MLRRTVPKVVPAKAGIHLPALGRLWKWRLCRVTLRPRPALYSLLGMLAGVLLAGCVAPIGIACKTVPAGDERPRVGVGADEVARWVDQQRIQAERVGRACDDACLRAWIGLPQSRMYWLPSPEQIAQIEPALRHKLCLARKDHPQDPPGSLGDYAIQYLGFERRGRRMIYVNAYRDGEHPRSIGSMKMHWLDVYDGGTSVFAAVYDLRTGTLDGPWFNGYA